MLGNQDVSFSLISAVREGRLEEVRELVNSYGLSYSQAWSEGYNLLCDAVKNKHTAVAKLLLTSGSNVNSKDENPSDTPLHFAVENGDIEIVRMILDKGANINAKDNFGRTALCTAIVNEEIEVSELLLKYGAEFNARDNHDISLLHVAVAVGCLQIIEHLLKYGADVNCVRPSILEKACTPLHVAVEKGNREVITLLLSRGANVEVKGEDDVTPLHIAAQNGFIHIAEDHGACIHSFTLGEGYTPLHFASELGNEEVVKLFLNKGADINASTNSNLTPLLIATKKGHTKVVKMLLQHGAKVDNQDKDGKTILHLAVEKGYSTIVEDILKYCPDIDHQSNRSCLKIAVHGHGKEYEKIFEALLEYGFILNPEDINNPKLLQAAVECGHLKIVDELLKYGADVNMSYNSFQDGFTPLHSAVNYKREEVAKLLIRYGADINAQDETGKTPIFHAIERADPKITKLLLSNRANIKDNPDLLNFAVEKKFIEIVETLLQHDADINSSDKYGRTSLHFTVLNDYEFGSDSEFESFCELENPTIENPDIDRINGEIAELLLSRGANVDSKTKSGMTTLHAAIQKGYAKVVEALLKYNANVNCGVESDITPLHLSAQKGNKEIIMMILNKGANVNAKLKYGTTALHIASREGHKEVVKLLLESGAKVNSRTENGWTPLHSASLEGHKEVVKVLLESGAKVNSRTKYGETPLHLGTEKGFKEIVETILKFGGDINARNEAGRTALHIASQEGHDGVVVTLLEYFPDINIMSKNNHTPLDDAYAEITNFYDYDNLGFIASLIIAVALELHILKMQTANLYVSEKNLLSMKEESIGEMYFEVRDFLKYSTKAECEEEIASMKREKINNPNISFYDILAKGTRSFARYMRNENIEQVLKSVDYKTKFPIYASMIESSYRKGLERIELLEQSNKIFDILFSNLPKLPYDCTEEIFSYLSNGDLRILMDACEPLSISHNDVVIT